jgi:hypothetical protein
MRPYPKIMNRFSNADRATRGVQIAAMQLLLCQSCNARLRGTPTLDLSRRGNKPDSGPPLLTKERGWG